MKNLKQILQETGEYQEPTTYTVECPEWEEPNKPPKKWMTIGDLVGLIVVGAEALYGGALSVIFMCFWIVVVLLLLATLVKGCQ